MHTNQLKDLIAHTLAVMDKNLRGSISTAEVKPRYHTQQAVRLLFGTACVESDCGYYIKQINGGALGMFQMENATHDDIWQNHIRFSPPLLAWMMGEIPPNHIGVKFWLLESNIRYAIMMARLHYYRVSEPIPKGATSSKAVAVESLAKYWKQHYNTHKGKGKVSDFCLKFNHHKGDK